MIMRDESRRKKEGVDHKAPNHVTSDGMDTWYMMQRNQEKEMRLRRQEAEQLLRGYRGPYFSGEDSPAWSPRSQRKSRSSFGLPGTDSEILIDPATEKRRQTTMPRIENHFEDPLEPKNLTRERKSLDPGQIEMFENSTRERDEGTGFDYDRRSLFRDNQEKGECESESREPAPTTDPSRVIDSTLSLGGFSHEVSGRKSTFSTESRDREEYSRSPFPVEHPDAPVTSWRDFISPGEHRESLARNSLHRTTRMLTLGFVVLFIVEPGAKFQPETGRYHLYASYACPGSHRALIVRALKGLEDCITVTIVHPTWRHTNRSDSRDKHRGWVFGDPNGKPFHNTAGRGGPFPPAYYGNEADPILGAYSVRELYESAGDTSGKYTIPLLWDKQLGTIVNNESSDIAYMLNSCFNDFSSNAELDLYTEDDEDGLDKLNEVSQWLYPMMIHGVYRCGFAKTQMAYDHAIDELTSAFDMADELLQSQRYLTGDTLTDADIRLFVTLLRFDEVYAFYFRANTRFVMLTPSLLNFCREIYQMPGIAETCHMDQIKAHFFGSHAEWNKYSVVPRGLGFMRLLDLPHDRDQFETPQG